MLFPQLYTVTSYSLLSSTIRIQEFVQQAKNLGYETVGITDRNVLSGAIEFYEACKKEGLKPIFGLSLDVTLEVTETNVQLLLFAKNGDGYKQLMKISSEKMSNTGSFYLETMAEEWFTDLFAVFLPNYEMLSRIDAQQIGALKLNYQQLIALFDARSVYLGASFTCNPEEAPELFSFYEQLELPLLALQEVKYLYKEDDFSLKVLEAIDQGTHLKPDHALTELEGPYYLRTAGEVGSLLADRISEEAVNNAQEMARHCLVEIPLNQKLLPHFPISENKTAGQYLKEQCWKQLPKRIVTVTSEYEERLERELAIIHKMGFDDYFLIVWDVMAFAHRKKIVTGAGRGSAAGSLVSYVLSITDVDPIKYDLLFERFLNPERYSMPDIDLDFPDNKREEVLQYVKEKYGSYHMAQIATFGTMAAKMVLRDAARVFGLSQSESNKWSAAVPNSLKMTLQTAFKESKQLRDLVQRTPHNQLLFDTAQRLEGLPRHVSTHAAGVVMSDQNLFNLVPLQSGTSGIFLTQFTMNDVEKIGLLKMDFLGLRNLSILSDSIQTVKKSYNEEILLHEIPLDDQQTLALFQKGETSGIFQFESSGIKNVLRKLVPSSIEDIAAVNALYRPGPMQHIDLFIQRKKGIEAIQYVDPMLEPILKNTYGIIVYQEQIMQVASQMAGFSLGQADVLRRAVSKKKKNILAQEREHFIKGAEQQGHSEEKAKLVYDYIERFANYGFNRSHAFAYSFIGFQMAYFKSHYPGAFYVAILHSVRHNPTKVKEYLGEARKNKVSIQPPTINLSHHSFHLNHDKEIRIGFSLLKGMRKEFIQNILEERKRNGFYKTFNQFLLRIDRKWLKKETIEPLIFIGMFDELNSNRKQLMMSLESEIQNIVFSSGSIDLLADTLKLKEIAVTDYSLEEKLEQEEQYLGVYLSGHPTEEFKKIRMAKQVVSISGVSEKQVVRLLIYVKTVRIIRTKKGEQMAFVEGDDDTGELSLTLFPTVFRSVRQTIEKNNVYYVEGKIQRSSYNQELQVLVDFIREAREMERQISSITCYLKVSSNEKQTHVLKKIQTIIRVDRGTIPVVIYFEKDGKKIGLTEEYWVNETEELKKELKALLGDENVIFK